MTEQTFEWDAEPTDAEYDIPWTFEDGRSPAQLALADNPADGWAIYYGLQEAR